MWFVPLEGAGVKILLFSKYSRTGASSRLRMLQYIPFLRGEGIDVTVANLLDEEYLNRLYEGKGSSVYHYADYYIKRLIWILKVRRFDLVWLEKELYPYFPACAEQVLKLLGVKVVVDYDDAIFHSYDLSNKKLIKAILSDKISKVMRAASCVIAGNSYLADYAVSSGAKEIVIVPTVIDIDRYSVVDNVGIEKKLVIGWMGSPSTQQYVVEIKRSLISACIEFNAKLVLIGANVDLVDEFEGIDVEILAWSEQSEVEMIQRMDIGIMPLKDGPWEKGKCGYKLIQYMACGLPVVASPIGVNVDIVNGSHCGFLAESLDEWNDSLSRLLSSVECRLHLGMAGRSVVESHYSMQVQAPVLARIFRETVA